MLGLVPPNDAVVSVDLRGPGHCCLSNALVMLLWRLRVAAAAREERRDALALVFLLSQPNQQQQHEQ